jgi:hypothetical protein
MSPPDVTGSFEAAGVGFSVVERAGRLVMVEPDVPEGFEPVLEWTGPATLRISTGPWAGMVVVFDVEEGRVTGGLAGGVIPVERADEAPSATSGAGLLAPSYRTDPGRDEKLRATWNQRSIGNLLTAPDHVPVHTFVQWLMAREEFIFHGSNRTEITELEPRRESMEVNNVGGHGNLGAVYGTHDGLWAMFFAIVDRSKLRGSIRNGVGTYTTDDGRSTDLYRFSVEYRSLADRPFRSGALYLFPRERFERIPLYPGGPPSNEWACFDPVSPLAAISVTPDDFPFLDQIGGHDDGDLVRLGEVGDQVFTHVVSAVRITNGVRLTFDGRLNPEVRSEWIELGRRFYPDVSRILIDEATVDLSGPPAFVHGIEQRFADMLEPEGSNS